MLPSNCPASVRESWWPASGTPARSDLILWLHPIFLFLQLLRLSIKLFTLFQVQISSLFSFLRLQDYGPGIWGQVQAQTKGFELLMARAHTVRRTLAAESARRGW